jgi:hypothetical protein
LPVVADDGARAVFSIASQSSTSVACRPLRLGRPPGPGVVLACGVPFDLHADADRIGFGNGRTGHGGSGGVVSVWLPGSGQRCLPLPAMRGLQCGRPFLRRGGEDANDRTARMGAAAPLLP